MEEFDAPPRQTLRKGLWGVRRGVARDEGTTAKLVRSLEDAPFYTRSEITSQLAGEAVTGVHETFDGDRFGTRWVKALLPFRMPRRAG